MNEDLLLTVGVLAAALVYITKTALDYVVKKRNGKHPGEDRIGKIFDQVKAIEEVLQQHTRQMNDLHDWHAPQIDADTGQPRFVWYTGASEIRAEMEVLESKLDEIIKAVSDE